MRSGFRIWHMSELSHRKFNRTMINILRDLIEKVDERNNRWVMYALINNQVLEMINTTREMRSDINKFITRLDKGNETIVLSDIFLGRCKMI